MKKEEKRLTISVPEEMEDELKAAKDGRYEESTRGDMLRDLIRRGLLFAKDHGENRSA